jgi:hypothetical protein
MYRLRHKETKRNGGSMILDTGTMVAIIIALACSCFVMVLSIVKYGALYRENQELTEKLRKGKK